MEKNVLSLFDGISGLQVALKKSKIDINQYYASEIDQSAISITQHHFPNTIQLGSVSDINTKKLPPIWLLSAGSPCQNFSIAGNKKGMVDAYDTEITSLGQYLKLKKNNHKFHGQSYLFWEFIRIFKETKPKYFLLENVRMTDKWKTIISKELNCTPILINSSDFSIQNRSRLYWTNIPFKPYTKKNVLVSDVIPNGITGFGYRGVYDKKQKKYVKVGTKRKDNKLNCITTSKGTTAKILLNNNTIRDITIKEAEQAQTLPINYTKVKNISDTQRWHAIGNGWTIDVIKHLLKNLK